LNILEIKIRCRR